MIPTRDELIARANGELHSGVPRTIYEVMADFALAEIRRALREELAELRKATMVEFKDSSAQWTRGREFAHTSQRIAIDARLAALRQAEQPPVAQRTGTSCAPSNPVDQQGNIMLGQNLERASSTLAPGITDKPGAESQAHSSASSERDDGRAASSPCPPPALSDADSSAWLIELSAPGAPSVWLGKCGWTSPDLAVRFAREQDARDAYSLFARSPSQHVRFTEHVWCAKLRAASAPKPVDVFEAFDSDCERRGEAYERVARDWFGPLDEALDHIEKCSTPEIMRETARFARAALRQRAQEASQ